MALEALFPLVEEERLYRHYWKGKASPGMDYDALVREVYGPRLAGLRKKCIDAGWIEPKGVFGYFPCRSEGEVLRVYSPADFSKALETFRFPRQKKKPYFCLADYFAGIDSEEPDVLGLFAVTTGGGVLETVAHLNEQGDFDEAFYLQGLAMAVCEAAAKWLHRRMRRELGLEKHYGKRYSFGFPPCPDLADQAKLFRLLQATDLIGVGLTDSFQMDPELSISALVVHHRDAVYFNI
jgi:5-methyltetrahydrofolate--homocysteine methyltransferase